MKLYGRIFPTPLPARVYDDRGGFAGKSGVQRRTKLPTPKPLRRKELRPVFENDYHMMLTSVENRV